MTEKSNADRLDSLGLLDWAVLSTGRQRGWVTPSDVSRFATSCLSKGVSDDELPMVSALATAETLSEWDIDELLVQLSQRDPGQFDDDLDKWRLAMLLELQAQDLEWEEKVMRLEESAAVFGYPADMQQCSRYSDGSSDPLDEMASLISNLKNRLSIS